MRISAVQYAKAILSFDEERNVTEIAGRILVFLRKHRMMKKVPEIFRIAEKLADERARRLTLSIETAHEVDPAFREDIERFAMREFPGMMLSFVYRIRPELLGGVRIASDETMIDATVRRRLMALKSKIRS